MEIEELKNSYNKKILELEKNYQIKLNESIEELKESHNQQLLKLHEKYESNLLIEKSHSNLTEQKLKEFYQQKFEKFQENSQNLQQTLENKLKIQDITIEKYQSELLQQEKKYTNLLNDNQVITKNLEENIVNYQEEIVKLQNKVRNYEYISTISYEISAIIILLYRHGRIRTTDDYNSNELYNYLIKSNSRGGEEYGQEEEEWEEDHDGGRRNNQKKTKKLLKNSSQEQEMIVELNQLKKAYELCKVSDSQINFRSSFLPNPPPFTLILNVETSERKKSNE